MNLKSSADIFKNLKALSDKELAESTLNLVKSERNVLSKILHHLREIERRKLYSALGFPSLFDYAVEKLGYSEAEAYRGISAMRALTEMPELEEKVTSGAISLTNVSLAQTVFRREAKVHGNPFSREAKVKLLKSLEGKTTREAEKAVLALSSSPHSLMSDRMRPVGDNASEIKFAGSKELMEKVARLRGLLAHSHPNISLGQLFEKLCDLGIEKWSPEFAAPRKQRDIWRRDKGRCAKCGSIYRLEFDHIFPRALGGDNSAENLRLLCRSCNQRAAIEVFGVDKIHQAVSSKRIQDPQTKATKTKTLDQTDTS